MIDEISADGAMPIHRKRDLQLRSNPINAGNKNRFPHSRKIRSEQPAEPAYLAQHLGPMRLPDESVDLALQSVAKINVNSRARISLLHGEKV